MSLSDDSNRNTGPASVPLTRRQFLPLLGATAVAALAPRTTSRCTRWPAWETIRSAGAVRVCRYLYGTGRTAGRYAP